MNELRWWRQSIPWGDIVVQLGGRSVVEISLRVSPVDEFDGAPRRDRSIARQLDEYFAGRRREFDVELDGVALKRALLDLEALGPSTH